MGTSGRVLVKYKAIGLILRKNCMHTHVCVHLYMYIYAFTYKHIHISVYKHLWKKSQVAIV